ncbi:hypothetical protein [Hydrogenophaga sp.]|uniref:hypothetical protein n=1 Tax=Hydrogenophaga sp. TaxID=1904254 RepID=UPI00344E1CFC|nr:hypothetical protein [Hydrogenophaga sp.]
MNLSDLTTALPLLPAHVQMMAAVVAALVVLALGLEWRLCRTRSRGASWAVLRLTSLLAAGLCVLVVLVPARAVSGMEGLAVFYGLLFTLAPLIWFGTHLLLGPRLRPAFSVGESTALSLSGLLIWGLPLIALVNAIEPLQAALRHAQDNPRDPGPPTALAHTVQPVRQFALPQAGVVYAQSLTAPPGLRLQRVDERHGERWEDMRERTHPRFCLDGASVHLVWSAREGAPWLRLHWVGTDGQRVMATHRPDTAAGATEPLEVGFRADGFSLPVPVPRYRVWFALHEKADGQPSFIPMANSEQPGERHDHCVMPDYRRVNATNEGPVKAVMLQFGQPGQPAWFDIYTRPAP